MTAPGNYTVQFTYQSKAYTVDLFTTTSPQVTLLTIGGVKYACLTDQPESGAVQAALKTLSKRSLLSKIGVLVVLRANKAISAVSITTKTNNVAKKLLPKPQNSTNAKCLTRIHLKNLI